MRVLSVFVLFSVGAVCQTVSGRQPAVAWRRQMAPLKNPLANDTAAQPLELAAPPLQVFLAGPPILFPAAPLLSPPAPPAPSRSGKRNALAEVKAGASRADILALLGPPAYSVGIPEGSHFVERCRFRAGQEDLAIIEFRDGRVAAILVM